MCYDDNESSLADTICIEFMNFEKKQVLEHSTDSVERYRRLKDTLAAVESKDKSATLIGTEYTIIGPGSAIDGGGNRYRFENCYHCGY